MLIELKWIFDNITEIGLKKYKILASNDNWTSEIEWPGILIFNYWYQIVIRNIDFIAEIKRSQSYKIDDPYCTKETKSNFECFNACINEPQCVYVQKAITNGINCFLSDKIIQNGTIVKYAESASILGESFNEYWIIDESILILFYI